MSTPENAAKILKQLDDFKALLAQGNPPSIWKYLDECQETLRKVHESLSNPKQKQVLGEMLTKAAETRTQFQAMVPGILADMQKTEKDSRVWIQEFSAKMEQTEKSFQDRLRAEAELAASLEAPPPAVPIPAIEPNHGADLAQDLLKTLGLLDTAVAKGKKSFEDAGSVARVWSETESTESDQSILAPPPAAPPPAKPDRATLKPRPVTPLRRPPREQPKPPTTRTDPDLDESIGRGSFEDE